MQFSDPTVSRRHFGIVFNKEVRACVRVKLCCSPKFEAVRTSVLWGVLYRVLCCAHSRDPSAEGNLLPLFQPPP